MYYFVIKKKYCQICTCLFSFHFFYLFVLTFAMKLKDTNYKSYWNILVFCHQWEMVSYLNVSYENISGFVSFPMFGLTVVIKLRKFHFESHWNTIRFEYIPRKNDWFCFISIVCVHFSHKTDKCRFCWFLKYFNIFW